MRATSSERRAPYRPTGATVEGLGRGLPWPSVGLLVLLPILLGAFAWLLHLEQEMPRLRLPAEMRAEAARAALFPGAYGPSELRSRAQGDWTVQSLGAQQSLTTRDPSARIVVTFIGSGLALDARVGPEAGRAYVVIDDRPVPHLAQEDGRSYVDLEASKAMSQRIQLVSGLPQRPHTLVISTSPDAELALNGLVVEQETPFRWAFDLAYATLLIGLALTLRGLAVALARRLGWLPEGGLSVMRQRGPR